MGSDNLEKCYSRLVAERSGRMFTRKTVERLTGAPKATVAKWLAKLVEDGRLTRHSLSSWDVRYSITGTLEATGTPTPPSVEGELDETDVVALAISLAPRAIAVLKSLSESCEVDRVRIACLRDLTQLAYGLPSLEDHEEELPAIEESVQRISHENKRRLAPEGVTLDDLLQLQAELRHRMSE